MICLPPQTGAVAHPRTPAGLAGCVGPEPSAVLRHGCTVRGPGKEQPSCGEPAGCVLLGIGSTPPGRPGLHPAQLGSPDAFSRWRGNVSQGAGTLAQCLLGVNGPLVDLGARIFAGQ